MLKITSIYVSGQSGNYGIPLAEGGVYLIEHVIYRKIKKLLFGSKRPIEWGGGSVRENYMNKELNKEITTGDLGLPDVSHESLPAVSGRLDRVGMEKIEMPILEKLANEQTMLLPARVDSFVSLDQARARGIHMSRLYLALMNRLKSTPISFTILKDLVTQFVTDQGGLSESGFLRISYELPTERKALISDLTGWRHYPVQVGVSFGPEGFEQYRGAQVTYASTCPCSSALAEQVMLEEFQQDFATKTEVAKSAVESWLITKGLQATPHAQRSVVSYKVKLAHSQFAPSHLDLINLVEACLKTPVQAAVKRPDEQEFARLNAQNRMFCEDAARRVQRVFEKEAQILDYIIEVEHQESLHPHNASSACVKGIPKGFSLGF